MDLYLDCNTACDCGCEADGDWHWDGAGCQCVNQRCPCVVDTPGAGIVVERDVPTRSTRTS